MDPSKYNTHSFRIGAAASAKQAGVSDSHLKALGRWKSDAYKKYIRLSSWALKISCILTACIAITWMDYCRQYYN